MRKIWFDLGEASFLIRVVDYEWVLFLNEKRGRGELTDEEVRRMIFYSVLEEWRGVGGLRDIAKEKQKKTLYKDPVIKTFVLQKSTELLEGETEELERCCTLIEKYLFESGKLQS